MNFLFSVVQPPTVGQDHLMYVALRLQLLVF